MRSSEALPWRTVLFLGAHPDDEFGCLGTLARLVEEGKDVHAVAFSPCHASIPEGLPQDVLRGEMLEAMARIGVSEERVTLGDYPVRHFPRLRQEILEELVEIRGRIQPDLVILPALSDIHQDHQVVAREGIRAFKFASILGYELPMNTITFEHACFVSLTPGQLERKLEGLRCYRSQAFRPYATDEFVRSLAKVRGVQVNTEYAEAFQAIRLSI
ncbi:MAG: PIG-L deacetylase family protein [Planctomycetota bacterium]|jgi:LmbE family N-acetylglucosaminyl deacetylase